MKAIGGFSFIILLVLVFMIPFNIDVRDFGIDIPLVNTTLEGIAIVLLLAWGARRLGKRDFEIWKGWYTVPVIVLVVLYFICAAAADENVIWAIRVAMKFLMDALLFFAIIDIVRSGRDLKRISMALFVSAMFVCLLGFSERFAPGVSGVFSIFFKEHFRLVGCETLRIKSTFAYPNILAMYLEMSVFIIIGAALNRKKKAGMSIPGWIGLLVMIEALILTYSRGGLLGFFAGILVMLFVSKRNIRLKLHFRTLAGIAVVSLMMFGATTVFDTAYANRVKSLIDTSAPSNRERLYLWKSAAKIIVSNPLLGLGPDNFRFAYARDYAEGAPSSTMRIINGVPSHNSNSTPLEMGSGLGIPGMAVFILLVIAGFRKALEALKAAGKENTGGMLVGITGCYTAFMTHGTFDYFLGEHSISLLFWLMLAMVVVLGRLAKGEG